MGGALLICSIHQSVSAVPISLIHNSANWPWSCDWDSSQQRCASPLSRILQAGTEILTTSGFGGCSTNTDRRVPFRTDLDETPVVVERSRWSAIRVAVLAKGADSPRVECTRG